MNSTANWILKNGSQSIDCTSFPYAYRALHGIVKKALADKKPVNTNDLSILGPKNLKNERTTYSYAAATKLATEQGLLNAEGMINSREFKKRY